MIDILDVVRSQDLVSDITLELVGRYTEVWNTSAYDALLDCHILSEKELASAVARHLDVSRIVTVSDAEIERQFGFDCLSYKRALEFKAIFVTPIGESITYLVVADPSIQGFEEFWDALPFDCSLAIGEKSLILNWIDSFYPIQRQLPSLFNGSSK